MWTHWGRFNTPLRETRPKHWLNKMIVLRGKAIGWKLLPTKRKIRPYNLIYHHTRILPAPISIQRKQVSKKDMRTASQKFNKGIPSTKSNHNRNISRNLHMLNRSIKPAASLTKTWGLCIWTLYNQIESYSTTLSYRMSMRETIVGFQAHSIIHRWRRVGVYSWWSCLRVRAGAR